MSEMRDNRPEDEIDAVIGDETHGEDLAATAAIIHDLRSAYLSDEPLVPSRGLMAAMDAPRSTAGDTPTAGEGMQSTGRNRRVLTKLGALTAGVTGKIVVGAAVAATAAGGLNATDVIEIPNLGDAARNDPPGLSVAADRTPDAAPVTVDESSTTNPVAPASENSSTTTEAAHANADAAVEFTTAVEEWVSCVSTAASAHEGGTGRFDPGEACGDRPHPADFGLTIPPSPKHDTNPSENAGTRRGRPETAPGTAGSPPNSKPDTNPASNRSGNDRAQDGQN